MILTLPLPPTDNNLRIPTARGGKAGMVKSKVYRYWENQCHCEWFKFQEKLLDNQKWQLDVPTFERQHVYQIKIFMASKRTDISNFTKALKDWCKGNVYTEDKWVDFHIQMPVQIDKDNPRVEIFLEPLIIKS